LGILFHFDTNNTCKQGVGKSKSRCISAPAANKFLELPALVIYIFIKKKLLWIAPVIDHDLIGNDVAFIVFVKKEKKKRKEER